MYTHMCVYVCVCVQGSLYTVLLFMEHLYKQTWDLRKSLGSKSDHQQCVVKKIIMS